MPGGRSGALGQNLIAGHGKGNRAFCCAIQDASLASCCPAATISASEAIASGKSEN